MIPKLIKCDVCGYDIEVGTYRKFVKCPACEAKKDFEGFEYREIDWSGSAYANVKLWQDCPACRSQKYVFRTRRQSMEMSRLWL